MHIPLNFRSNKCQWNIFSLNKPFNSTDSTKAQKINKSVWLQLKKTSETTPKTYCPQGFPKNLGNSDRFGGSVRICFWFRRRFQWEARSIGSAGTNVDIRHPAKKHPFFDIKFINTNFEWVNVLSYFLLQSLNTEHAVQQEVAKVCIQQTLVTYSKKHSFHELTVTRHKEIYIYINI